jgi:hypothetical protein
LICLLGQDEREFFQTPVAEDGTEATLTTDWEGTLPTTNTGRLSVTDAM